ncbi:hypothetical protein [Oceanisphaera sp. KMM 10153]|uniref:hypothetical protein n=1 Tax=Oceanisphaera submarina TaxID=3390193 RepID=UPI00397622F6
MNPGVLGVMALLAKDDRRVEEGKSNIKDGQCMIKKGQRLMEKSEAQGREGFPGESL